MEIDPNTALGGGLAILASKEILNQMLGPTAEYIGEEAKHLVEKASNNLGQIFQKATKKLGSKLNESGVVNPRVFKQVWQEGAFIEDALAAEYFGGLLAAARSPDGKDDRALSLISTVRDLSVYDLKLHFLIYTLIRQMFVGKSFSVTVQEDRVSTGLCIPFRVYLKAMGLKNDPSAMELLGHSIITLTKQELIDHRFAMGNADRLKSYCKEATEAGIVVIPSFFGAELFFYAHGHAESRLDHFLYPELAFDSEYELDIEEGTIPLKPEPANDEVS